MVACDPRAVLEPRHSKEEPWPCWPGQSSQVSRLQGQRAACRKQTKWRGLAGTAGYSGPAAHAQMCTNTYKEKSGRESLLTTLFTASFPLTLTHMHTHAHACTHARPCCSNFFSPLPCPFDLAPHPHSSLPLLLLPFFLSSSSSTCK